MQQEIVQVADAAIRVYTEVTPFNEKSDQGVVNAMRVVAKDKATKLISKMGKLLAIANPAHGPVFLEEVCYLFYF